MKSATCSSERGVDDSGHSVLIAGFDSSHSFHEPAQEALAGVQREGRLIAHTIAETFAVLKAAGPYEIPASSVGEREARATLVSLDRRAGATYRGVGVELNLLP